MKFDYTQYPGKNLNKIDFEIDTNQKPIVSIITPYYNGQKYIDETANSILNQTFPYWEWVIIDDGSNEEAAKQKLNDIKSLDKRIKILTKENEGVAAARDYGVKNSNNQTKYLMFLDSDDVIDKTYLECCYWTLETNPEASWTFTDVVNFDGKNYLWRKWYNPIWEQDENILTVTSFIKREAFEEVGGFDLKEKKVYEDWCFWLKLIKKEKFPVRMSSLLTWYRIKPVEESELGKSKNENKERALKLVDNIKKDIINTKNAIQYPKSEYNWDEIPDEQENIVPVKTKRTNKINVLLIIPWMVTGGADKFNLDLIARSDHNKYEYTIVSTIPNANPWRQDFEKYGTVYDLTTFLDRKNWASFLNYLIEKNNIDIIFNTNSQYGYNVLPYLKARYPEIPIIDYVHMEEWYDRNGGFSRDSSQYEAILDKTYTCNENSRNIFIKHFTRCEKDVETMYIGVDEKKFNPSNYNKEEILKEFNVNLNGKIAIGFICRLAEQKRPFLLMEVIKELKRVRKDFVFLIAGDGPFLKDMQKQTEKYNLKENIIFLGNIKETEKFYTMCDMTL